MRNVEDGEAGDAAGMEKCNAPGHGGSPVMPSQEDFLLAELIGNSENIGDEFAKGVGGNAAGFSAEVVPALIGNDDAKTGGSERFDLAMPAIPEFGKAVKEKGHGSGGGSGGNGVKRDGAVLERESFHGSSSGTGSGDWSWKRADEAVNLIIEDRDVEIAYLDKIAIFAAKGLDLDHAEEMVAGEGGEGLQDSW